MTRRASYYSPLPKKKEEEDEDDDMTALDYLGGIAEGVQSYLDTRAAMKQAGIKGFFEKEKLEIDKPEVPDKKPEIPDKKPEIPKGKTEAQINRHGGPAAIGGSSIMGASIDEFPSGNTTGYQHQTQPSDFDARANALSIQDSTPQPELKAWQKLEQGLPTGMSNINPMETSAATLKAMPELKGPASNPVGSTPNIGAAAGAGLMAIGSIMAQRDAQKKAANQNLLNTVTETLQKSGGKDAATSSAGSAEQVFEASLAQLPQQAAAQAPRQDLRSIMKEDEFNRRNPGWGHWRWRG